MSDASASLDEAVVEWRPGGRRLIPVADEDAMTDPGKGPPHELPRTGEPPTPRETDLESPKVDRLAELEVRVKRIEEHLGLDWPGLGW